MQHTASHKREKTWIQHPKMKQIRGGWWNRCKICLIVTTILFALVCVWVIYSIGDKQDSEGTTDDVGITMIKKKKSEKFGPVNSQVDKRKKREITLQKELTDHPLNTYLALSLQYAQAMDKSKCWVCSHLPHSSKHGLPLFTIPLKGEDMCGYLVLTADKIDQF